MRVKSKSWFYFILFLLILPGIAFAWGEGFSIVSSSSFTELTAAITPSSSSFQPVSSYSPSESASYSTTQTFTIPASFQAIISKFDISQAVVPSEAIIQQGLQQALDFSVKSPLEGNDYKAAMIQPIMNLLLSGNYSDTTRDLCFSNLLSIVLNERIDYSEKSTMVDPLITYMENKVTAVNNGTVNVESAENEISEIDTIFASLLQCKDITVEEQKDILVSISTNKVLFQNSAIKPDLVGLKAIIYETLMADKNYPLTLIDNLNKDQGKLALMHSLEKAIDQNTDTVVIGNIISSINAFLKDSTLPSSEVSTLKNTTIFVLKNRAGEDYDLKMVCLSTLMNLSKDTRLTETERNEVKETISTYGLNSYNTSIYQNTGVLLLSQDNNDYNSQAANAIVYTLTSLSQDKRPILISLERQITSNGKLGSMVETNALHGTYCRPNDVIAIKVSDTYTYANYKSTVLHETTHYLENNVLTTEQKTTLQSIWNETNDPADFVNTLGQENTSEYLATTAEAILMEYDAAQKPLLERAQQQAANNDPTLLKMYNLVEDVWGLS
ncbi:MAG: hypothetical protein WBE75_03185 [Candidatus Omnitrophota bacterium]